MARRIYEVALCNDEILPTSKFKVSIRSMLKVFATCLHIGGTMGYPVTSAAIFFLRGVEWSNSVTWSQSSSSLYRVQVDRSFATSLRSALRLCRPRCYFPTTSTNNMKWISSLTPIQYHALHFHINIHIYIHIREACSSWHARKSDLLDFLWLSKYIYTLTIKHDRWPSCR